MKKITTGIYVIFRGLFFEHNADIMQKDHLWIDTNLECISADLRADRLTELRSGDEVRCCAPCSP